MLFREEQRMLIREHVLLMDIILFLVLYKN